MDLLIPLYGLPERKPAPCGIRRPIAPEHGVVCAWIAEHFSAGWSSEAAAALGNRPASLFIAQRDAFLAGFCCYDAAARGFVGPIGVLASERGRGTGTALLHACLHEMRAMGYGYAVAGHVGAPAFFLRAVAAWEIPGSTPGIYAGLLQ